MGACISCQSQPNSYLFRDSEGYMVEATEIRPTWAEKRAEKKEYNEWKKETKRQAKAAGFSNITFSRS